MIDDGLPIAFFISHYCSFRSTFCPLLSFFTPLATRFLSQVPVAGVIFHLIDYLLYDAYRPIVYCPLFISFSISYMQLLFSLLRTYDFTQLQLLLTVHGV